MRQTAQNRHEKLKHLALWRMIHGFLAQSYRFKLGGQLNALGKLPPGQQQCMMGQGCFLVLAHGTPPQRYAISIVALLSVVKVHFSGRFRHFGLYLHKSYANEHVGDARTQRGSFFVIFAGVARKNHARRERRRKVFE
jgi:hypothetical protein